MPPDKSLVPINSPIYIARFLGDVSFACSSFRQQLKKSFSTISRSLSSSQENIPVFFYCAVVLCGSVGI